MQPLVTGSELPEWAKAIGFVYGVFIQPGLLAYIVLQLRYVRNSMASQKDVKIAINEHEKECKNRLLEVVTPVQGKHNGHARLIAENLD